MRVRQLLSNDIRHVVHPLTLTTSCAKEVVGVVHLPHIMIPGHNNFDPIVAGAVIVPFLNAILSIG